MFCPKCGSEVKNGPFCPNCGAQIPANKVNQVQEFQTDAPEIPVDEAAKEVKEKKSKKLKSAADGTPKSKAGLVKSIIAAVVAVAIIVTGVIFVPKIITKSKLEKTNPFIIAAKNSDVKKSDPKVKLFSTVHNSLFNTKSFSAVVRTEDDYYLNIHAQFGKDLLTSSASATLNDGGNWSDSFVLYDSKFAIMEVYDGDFDEACFIDVASVLNDKDSFLNAYKEEIYENNDFTEAVLNTDLDALQTSLVSLIKENKFSYDSLCSLFDSYSDLFTTYIKTSNEEFSGEIPAFDEIYKAFSDFIINSDSVQVNEDKDGKEIRYTVLVDIGALLSDLSEYVRTSETVKKFLNQEEMVTAFADELLDEAEYYDEDDPKFKAKVTVSGDNITSVNIGTTEEMGLVKISFTDINKTKVDSSEMDKITRNKDKEDYYEISTYEEFIEEF